MIELLVVIGIIALLLAILLPTLARARASAQRVGCQSNLSEINRALQMYLNEYKGTLPSGLLVPGLGERRFPGSTVFAPYLEKKEKLQRVFICPADSDRIDGDEISYHVNESTFEKQDVLYHLKVARIRNKHKLVYIRDWWTRQDEKLFTSSALVWSQDCWPHYRRIYSEFMDVHRGGFNLLFVDGHVEWLPKAANASEFDLERIVWHKYGIRMTP